MAINSNSAEAADYLAPLTTALQSIIIDRIRIHSLNLYYDENREVELVVVQ